MQPKRGRGRNTKVELRRRKQPCFGLLFTLCSKMEALQRWIVVLCTSAQRWRFKNTAERREKAVLFTQLWKSVLNLPQCLLGVRYGIAMFPLWSARQEWRYCISCALHQTRSTIQGSLPAFILVGLDFIHDPGKHDHEE